VIAEAEERGWEHRIGRADGSWSEWQAGHAFGGDHVQCRPLYAAPSSGRMTAEMLEIAAEAQWNSSVAAFNTMPKWRLIDSGTRAQSIKDIRAALTAIGLECEPAGSGEEGK
jgi:hypothetical protein